MANLWLERELARQLAPVAAPDSLWDRVNRPPQSGRRFQPSRRATLEWLFWPIAAVMMLLAIAGMLRSSNTERDLAALPAAATRLDFRSPDFQAARAWVKAHANIDIDLPSQADTPDRSPVQVLGARLIQFNGLPVAAIDYRTGNEVATLFVSAKRAGLNGNAESSRHLFTRIQSAGNERLFSWNMRNQTYAIAFSGTENVHAACLLCHADTPGLMLLGAPWN